MYRLGFIFLFFNFFSKKYLIFFDFKFVSDIISVKRDKDNNVIEGNPDRIKTVTDQWKFSKKESSNSPNWYLAEILS